MKTQAKHVHDCDCCIYLGTIENKETETNVDMYYHGGECETLIARRSSDGSDYTSGLDFVYTNPFLNFALTIALQEKLITMQKARELYERYLKSYSPKDLRYTIEMFKNAGLERWTPN